MYEDLIFLFLKGQVSILRAKVPKNMLNNAIHSKEGIIAKFSDDCFKISDNYSEAFKKIKLQTNFSQNAKLNFKYLTHFEFLGEIYQKLNNEKFDKYEECLTVILLI